MSGRTAHVLEQKWRSDDIRTGEDADFSSLLLPKELLRGLTAAGFKYPSPIQLKAIPVGKIGKDLIVQAKSGTGKTLVFTVVGLNMLLKGATHPQILIMAPTREIACQICQVIKCVGVSYKGLSCEYFIGGRKLEEDISRIQGCQVIVGTPGRIKQLINSKILKTAGIRLFVLDEADQLLNESSFTIDIDDIFRALPRDKQLIATSATYPDKLKRLTEKYFRDPLLIRLNMKDIGLLGMVHYYRVIPVSKLPVIAYKEKLKFLEKILLSVKFAQCLVFCNMVSRVENLCVEIKNWGFATSYISSAREQEDRLKAIELLKRFKCKVLVSSDVSSRGIDAENVDLVINFDLPTHLDTYFHRVGRAGRYGSKCASVTFITSDEIEMYERMQNVGKFKSHYLPDLVPEALISLQPKIKHSVKNEELPLDNESESSSDSSYDVEGSNQNGVLEQKNSNSFGKDIQLNVHNELPSLCKVDKLVSENLTNIFDEKLVDAEISSSASSKSDEKPYHFNSHSINSVKEDDDLSSTSVSVELELDQVFSPVSAKLEEPEKVSETSSSSEFLVVEDENNIKSNKSNGEESYGNNILVERKLDQENLATLVGENTENCQHQPDEFASNSHELDQTADASSCLVDLENDSKTTDDKSLAMNNEFNASKIFKDPKSKELISSFVTFIKTHENLNKDSDKFSSAVCGYYSQSSNVESNSNKFSPEYLQQYRSGLHQYHYYVRKDFLANCSEDLIDEIAQGCGNENSVKVSETEEQPCLKQNDSEGKIKKSRLNSQHLLFSTPKAEVLSCVKSGDSSGPESSSGSDKLIEHFNLRLASINKVKSSANKNSTSESSSGSESNSDESVNSENAMHVLTEKFNKMSLKRAKCGNKETANIRNHSESSLSSSSSDSGTSVDSEQADVKLEQKFSELIMAQRSNGEPSKDTEETKKILREIQSTKKCFKGIEIVDSKKQIESSENTSDSDSSIDSRIVKGKPKKDINDRIQNVKSKIFNTRNPSESSSYKTKTVKHHAQNKITYSSESESDFDQYSKEPMSLQDVNQRKIGKNGKTVSKTDSGCRIKTLTNPVENKTLHYYSETSSSETESGISHYSKKSGSSVQVGHQNKRRNNKKDKTLPKTEPSPFHNYNSDGTPNPYFNPPSGRPNFLSPHLNYQTQPSYYTSNTYNGQNSQQGQNFACQGPFLGAYSNHQMQPTYYAPNPYYPSYPHQIYSHANGQFRGTQSSHQMHPTHVHNPLSQSYYNECPLKEFCQMKKMQSGSNLAGSRDNAGSSTDYSNPHRNSNPSQYAYNQCFMPSQHPCHPPNETCQSPACAAWYDTFYKQWYVINQASNF